MLCNEENTHRVGARYLTAACGMTAREIREDMAKASAMYKPVMENIKIKEYQQYFEQNEDQLVCL